MCSQCILVAEDNPVNQKVAELMLKRIGYECKIAPNGKIATEMLQEERFPVVLMDQQMPVMDGLTAARWIRDNMAAEEQPKIFVMTASLMSEVKNDWKELNVEGYIEKPVKVDFLKESIDAVMI